MDKGTETMFKRLFWIGIGAALGVLAVSKAQAYVRAKTPDGPRKFLLGSDQDNIHIRTLQGLISDFNEARRQREDELNREFANNLR